MCIQQVYKKLTYFKASTSLKWLRFDKGNRDWGANPLSAGKLRRQWIQVRKKGLKSREQQYCVPNEIAESKVKIRKAWFIAVVCIDLFFFFSLNSGLSPFMQVLVSHHRLTFLGSSSSIFGLPISRLDQFHNWRFFSHGHIFFNTDLFLTKKHE